MDTSKRWTDDRGVVAIAGLALAVFITAVMYYEIGVGDAIYFKEQLQDASDAAGFSAAVYHAKGMNMIVVINLIMAAVLAVIVVLKCLQVLFTIVAVLALALSFVPGLEWLEPVSNFCVDADVWVSDAIKTMTPIIKKALQGLNTAEMSVAVGMPWVALVKSGTVGVQYYPQATSHTGGGTIMLSMSLAPDVKFIPAVANAGNSPSEALQKSLKLKPGCESEIMGKRWGLPVSEGDFSELCSQAAQVLPTLLEDAIMAAVTHGKSSAPPTWVTWLNTAIGDALGSFPELFCNQEQISPPLPSCSDDAQQQEETIKKNAQKQCNADRTNFNACAANLKNGASFTAGGKDPCANGMSAQVQAAILKNGGNKLPPFDMKGCISKETDKLNKSTMESLGQDSIDQKAAALPMNVYNWAANGNDFMSIWSFGWGKFSNVQESGISLAEWSKNGVTVGTPQHVTMLTKAEFYYAVENPCENGKGGWDEGTKGSSANCTSSDPKLHYPFWGDYAADTLWNPRWVARLRRVSPPMIPIGQMADSGMASLLGSAMKKGFGMIPGVSEGGPDGAGAGWLIDFASSWIQLGTGSADSEIAGHIERAAGYEH